MNFFSKILTLAALAASSTVAKDPVFISRTKFGNSTAGKKFSDFDGVKPQMKIISAWIRGRDRVDAVGFKYTLPNGSPGAFSHGERGADELQINLGHGEYLRKVEAYSDSKGLIYLMMETNTNRSTYAGTMPTYISEMDMQDDSYQVGGFTGFEDNGKVVSLQTIWTLR